MPGSDEFERQLDYALTELEIDISRFQRLVEDCQREDLYGARDRARRALWSFSSAAEKFDPR